MANTKCKQTDETEDDDQRCEKGNVDVFDALVRPTTLPCPAQGEDRPLPMQDIHRKAGGSEAPAGSSRFNRWFPPASRTTHA